MNDSTLICPGCLAPIDPARTPPADDDSGSATVCGECGYVAGQERTGDALGECAVLQDRFLIGRILGRPGGHGITYLAWDLKLETSVAIKEYLPRYMAGRSSGESTVVLMSEADREAYSEGLAEFLDEARVLERFRHPNIVRVRDYFEANGTACMVMDYHEGRPLSELVTEDGDPLGAEAAVELMLPVLDGLAAVHEAGFLHRDVKPANIYLTDRGEPILLDFGAARTAPGDESRSLTVILTPGFAPLEQYVRRGKQGPWSDVYSAAATLYYLMSARKPPAALDRENEDELVPLAKINPHIPRAVSDVVMGALDRLPQRRPANASLFAEQLRSAIAGEPVRGAAASGMSRGLKATLAVVGLTLLATVLVLLWPMEDGQSWRAGVRPAPGTAPVAGTTQPEATPGQPAEARSAAPSPASTAPNDTGPTGTESTAPPSTQGEPAGAGTDARASSPASTSAAPSPAAPSGATAAGDVPSTASSSDGGSQALRPPPPRREQADTTGTAPRPPGTASDEPLGPPGVPPGGRNVQAGTGAPQQAGFGPPLPPPGAIQACASAAAGDACSFTTPRGHRIDSVCEVITGVMACAPPRRGPGGPPRPRPQ